MNIRKYHIIHSFYIILQYTLYIDFNMKQSSNKTTYYLNLKTKIYNRINTKRTETVKPFMHFMAETLQTFYNCCKFIETLRREELRGEIQPLPQVTHFLFNETNQLNSKGLA